MNNPQLEQTVANLPHEPGVYKFLDKSGTIIYIGKAKSLKNRVSSYFVKQSGVNRKTLRLISEIKGLEYVVVNTEFDALLLENSLIKENQPKYNILLKDDKTYPYICVTKERFPRVFSTRNIEDKQHRYFGPYASVRAMNTLLELIRQLFTIRTCSYDLSEENVAAGKYKVCLEYHIQNCKGPCEGLQPEADYNADMEKVLSILKGHLVPAKAFFKEQMQVAAERLEFEKAATYKKKLDIINNFQEKSLVVNPKIDELEAYSIIDDEEDAYVNFIKITNGSITQTESVQVKKKLEEQKEDILAMAILNFRERFNSAAKRIVTNIPLETDLGNVEATVPKIGDLKKLVGLSTKNALYFKKEKEQAKVEIQKNRNKNYTLIQLKADLNLPDLPRHIEGFDNSNLQGTNPVSAMVCFIDGKPAKKEYRHYHVKTVEGPNDFASMYEVVHRRYGRLLTEEKPLPNLILIDGGKGQLSSAVDALKDLGIYGKIPIIGIAKRLEEIYFPEDSVPLHINKKSRSLALLQKIRDESHRFGITFHRKTRSKATFRSSLDEIPGIGRNSKEKLLKEFKTIKAMKSASEKDLAAIIGKSRAKLLKEHFGGSHE